MCLGSNYKNLSGGRSTHRCRERHSVWRVFLMSSVLQLSLWIIWGLDIKDFLLVCRIFYWMENWMKKLLMFQKSYIMSYMEMPLNIVTSMLMLTFQSLPVTWCTSSLTINNCTFCPHCIYVFCIYLRTNSYLCHLQHKLIGLYNWVEKCLLRGTNWVFK